MKELMKILHFLIFLTWVAGPPLWAEEPEKYPSRPVTMTISYTPGGSADMICRAIAAVSPKYFSQPIVVVSKTGGGGLVALQNLASSKPDGYTLHFGRTGDIVIMPNVEKLPFNVQEAFTPIANVVMNQVVFSVNAQSPWKKIEDVIEAAKKEPGKISFATPGPLTIVSLAMENFCLQAGIKLNGVPFRGGGETVMALLGGHIPLLTSTEVEILSHAQRGAIRILMACSEERMKVFPNVPTAKEKGFKVKHSSIGGIFVPKETPSAVILKLEDMLKKITEDKDFIETIENKMGSEVKFMSRNEFVKYWLEDLKSVEDLVSRLGLRKKP
jgi:tripartite-type tricarboxylate transporter receptor subunit TctC